MAITAVTAATAALNLTTGGLLLAIGSIATAVGFLVSAFASGDDAVEDYDGTLSECRTEIEQTELALVKAIDRYGENSDAVQDLESKLDTLNKQYEAGGGAIAEYAETAGNAAKKLDELQKSENDAMTALDKTNVSGLTAVSMLESLSGKADITNADLDMMSGYADYLNDTFSCNIEVNYDTGELTGFDPGVIVKQIQDSYNEKKQTIAFDTISDVDFVDSYKAQYESLKSAKAELKALETELANISMTSAWGTVSKDGYSQSHVNDLIDQIGALKGSVSELETGMASYDAELQKNCDILDESGSLYEDMVNSLNGGTNSIEKYGEAVNDTMTEQEAWDEKLLNCQEELDNLCIAYDEAREAALKSIQDQYNAWDTVEEVSTMSVSSIQEALQSQTSYWTEYNDNLAGLQERASGIEGLSDMLTDVADGSENSAAMLAGLAGASDAELQTVVDNWLALQQQENDTADTMGDVASQFSVKTGEMISDMQNMVNGMDLSGDAAAAASTTTNAFFDTMEGVINARSGAITASLASIMHSANMSVPVRKHAKGTTDAENVFIAGENGAELIVGMGGSTVFPASETQKIINAVTDYADFSGNYTPQNTSSYSNTVTTFAPVFYLTLNGGMSQSNQKQAKRWMQQVTEDLFASIGRTNPAIYVI